MTESDQAPARYRSWGFAFAVVALSIFSFSGTLDKRAHDHNGVARDQALGAYVTVRTVNAGVSVLQTADVELGLPFFRVSGEVGQFLDPVNDAAERASTALAWSIGSLFVQGILLDFAALPLCQVDIRGVRLAGTSCPSSDLYLRLLGVRVGQRSESIGSMLCRHGNDPVSCARLCCKQPSGQPGVASGANQRGWECCTRNEQPIRRLERRRLGQRHNTHCTRSS